MRKLSSLIVGLLVVLGIGQMCIYTVGEREYAMVFALGELKHVVDEPGIHFKLPPPLQNVVYLDKRLLTLDTSGADLVQTSEKKNLMIDTFVKWRIGNPRLYWVSFQGSERAASDRLAALLRDVLNIAVNKRTVNQITSSEREKAMSEISELLQARVKDVGIDIVDVRMKRVDFTPEISESVYSRMEAERKRVASEERSKGAAQAERIRASADRQSEVILAEAYRDAQKTKGEGDDFLPFVKTIFEISTDFFCSVFLGLCLRLFGQPLQIVHFLFGGRTAFAGMHVAEFQLADGHTNQAANRQPCRFAHLADLAVVPLCDDDREHGFFVDQLDDAYARRRRLKTVIQCHACFKHRNGFFRIAQHSHLVFFFDAAGRMRQDACQRAVVGQKQQSF